MDRRFNWLPVQARLGASLAAWLISPLLTFAQEPVGPSSSPVAPAQAATEPQARSGKAVNDILSLDLEQLTRTPIVVPSMDIPVTSVTKAPSTVGHSAAAIFVITPEMIRRSGATCIPEALRMAPGLEVARIDQNKWAVSCRGFNSRYATNLLVLIDGRTVYTPVFSGVYWDTQDVVLEDVERIEVIRGPGGTLWGSNAVNGVINIITKKAKDTQGAYVMAGGGTQERLTDAARYGGRIGEDAYYRVYGKQFERGPGWVEGGAGPDDSWRQGRVGFRADWDVDRCSGDTLTVQGDCYAGESGVRDSLTTPWPPPFTQTIAGYDQVSGENLLARWRRTFDEESDWALQTYYDGYRRDGPLLLEEVKTLDLDFQYRFALTDRQKVVCGAGYRHIDDNILGYHPFTIYFDPQGQSRNLASGFLQDEIALVKDRLALTLGTKLEHNDYTGLEIQPSARLLWTPDNRHSTWAAISRAVRTPSRADESLVFNVALSPVAPVFLHGTGSTSFKSADMMAYEIGYREQTTDQFSWDVALFYDVYDNLSSLNFGAPSPPYVVIPATFANENTAEAYGLELASTFKVTESWRLSGHYTYLHMQVHSKGFGGTSGGNDPQNQVYLRSAWDIGPGLEFDLMTRYVDTLADLHVPSYITMDARLGWRPRKHWELAVVGQNLLQNHHLEFGNESSSRVQVTEVPRSVYGTLTWRY
ncbi:MAG: TonB-dependent receptor [Planctomycetota bacterium]